jgi:hypothetical protein
MNCNLNNNNNNNICLSINPIIEFIKGLHNVNAGLSGDFSSAFNTTTHVREVILVRLQAALKFATYAVHLASKYTTTNSDHSVRSALKCATEVMEYTDLYIMYGLIRDAESASQSAKYAGNYALSIPASKSVIACVEHALFSAAFDFIIAATVQDAILLKKQAA